MRIKNLLYDQPLKRNDSLNHNRDLSISIGGTGPFVFGHSWRYFIHRSWMVLSRNYQKASVAAHYLVANYLLSPLILMAYVGHSIAMPGSAHISVSKAGKSLCWGIKKGIDFFGALFGLILLIPLFLIISLVIKLDSPGPIFYSQQRIGLNRRRALRRSSECLTSTDRRARDRRRKNHYGRPFNVYKFRTMIDKAEKKCGPTWAIANDPRITRVGMFLRKTRMDELPQLINVLKGEMSLIGPRPERPMFIEDLSQKVENYTMRLQVKPGITGLAQIENGYDSSLESVKYKVAYDLSYINRWSLWQDIKILLKTVIVVITGKGAF